MPNISCSPPQQYGPPTRTLFLGLSVVSFSISAGINSQGSTLTVDLIKDTCPGNRFYVDSDLNFVQDYFEFGDPGWIFFDNEPDSEEPVGSPAYFRVGSIDETQFESEAENLFEFCGLISSYDFYERPDGSYGYKIILSSPNKILDNSYVITNDYSGDIKELPNVVNAFGFLETVLSGNQDTCDSTSQSLGYDYGTYSEIFGGSGNNNSGITWHSLRIALGILLGAPKAQNSSHINTFISPFSEFGSLVYQDGRQYPGGINYGSIYQGNTLNGGGKSFARYLLDLSEVPNYRDEIETIAANNEGEVVTVNENDVNLEKVEIISNEDASNIQSNEAQENNDSFTTTEYKNLRLNNSIYSISQLLNTLNAERSLDYFTELIPVRSNVASGQSGITLIIKIRVLNRKHIVYDSKIKVEDQLQIGFPDEIYNFAIPNGVRRNDLVSLSIGEEQVDKPQNSMILGAPKQEVYFTENCPFLKGGGDLTDLLAYPCTGINYNQATFNLSITPYWGKDANNINLIKSRYNASGFWEAELDFLKLNTSLSSPVISELTRSNRYNFVTEPELRGALGSFAYFKDILVKGSGNTALSKYVINLGINSDWQFIDISQKTNINAKGFVQPVPVDGLQLSPEATESQDIKRLYEYLNNYASEFYMKKFLVHAPFVCKSQPRLVDIGGVATPTGDYIYSDDPAPDGGWWEGSTLYGSEYPSFESDFITDYQNRLQASIVYRDVFGSGFVLDDLTEGSYITLTGNPENILDCNVDGEPHYPQSGVMVKAELDPQWVTGQPITGGVVTYANGDTDPISALISVQGAPSYKVAGNTNGVWLSLIDSTYPNNVVENNTPHVKPTALSIQDNLTSFPSLNAQITKVFPSQVNFAVKNNTDTYGPFTAHFSNVAGLATSVYFGNTSVTQDASLSPWEAGGYDAMEEIGRMKAFYKINRFFRTEKGSVELVGLPFRSIGDDILGISSTSINSRSISSWYPVLYQKIGTSEDTVLYTYHNVQLPPSASNTLISNINVSMGAGGFKTQYTLKTYTKTFGRTPESDIEDIKQNSLNILKRDRENRNLDRLFSKQPLITTNNRSLDENLGGGSKTDNNSAGEVIKGVRNTGTPGASVANVPLNEVMRNNYDKEAAASLDSLYRPISKFGSNGDLPHYSLSGTGNIESTGTRHQTQSPTPPLKNISGVVQPPEISAMYLDFLSDVQSNTIMMNDSRIGQTNSGHDIDALARGTSDEMQDISFSISEEIERGGVGYTGDYRFLGIRGPLMMQGWGYDIYGKPIPNSNGDEDGNIDSSYDDKTDEFKLNFLQESSGWPVAPVDLRYDRRRGVWTSPPSFRLLKVEVTGEPISGETTGDVSVLNPGDYYDAEGTLIDAPFISIDNFTSETLSSGSKGLAYFDTYDDKYYPIFNGGSGNNLTIYDISACTGCGELPELDIPITVTGSGGDSTGVVATSLHFRSGISLEEVKDDQGNTITGSYYVDGGIKAVTTDINGCKSDFYDSDLLSLADPLPYIRLSEDVSGLPFDLYGQNNSNLFPQKITFHSGLLLVTGTGTEGCNDDYDCNAYLMALPQTYISGYNIVNDQGYSITGSGKTYSKITLGSGLTVEDSGCTAVIEGLKVQDYATGCQSSSILTDYESVARLSFRSGLTITTGLYDGDNIVDIPNSFILDAVPSINVSGSGLENGFETVTGVIFEGSGIGLEVNSCLATVSVSGLYIKDTAYTCDPVSIMQSYDAVNKLDFGSGLYVTGTNGTYQVNAIPKINISGDQGFENATGLSFTGSGNATVTVSVDNCIASVNVSGSGLQIKDTAYVCDPAPIVLNYSTADNINFGSGLYVSGSQGNYTVHSVPKIHISGDAGFETATGLRFTSSGNAFVNTNIDNCVATINVSGSGLQIKDDYYTCDPISTISNYTNADSITFGTGLHIVGTNGSYEVHAIPQINISEDYGQTYLPVTGIRATGIGSVNVTTERDGCVASITVSGSGDGLQIMDRDWGCDLPSTITTYTEATGIVFGSGLHVDEINGAYEVNSIPSINISENYGQTYAPVTGIRATGVGGITVTTERAGGGYGCVASITVSGSGGTKIKDTAYSCDPTSVLATYTDATGINFGSGLHITGSDGLFEINAIPKINISGDAGFVPVTGLKFTESGNVFVDTSIDGCVATVNVSGSGLQIKDTAYTCDPASVLTSYTTVDRINFGTGLQVTGANGEYTVNSASKINFNDGITDFGPKDTVSISGTLYAEDDGCSITISGRYPVVCNETADTTDCYPGTKPYSHTSNSEVEVDHFVAGTGLVFSDRLGELGEQTITLDSIPEVYVKDSGSSTFILASGIEFTGGLSASVSSCLATATWDGMQIYGHDPCRDTPAYLSATAKSLIFHSGLKVSQSGSSDSYFIAPNFQVAEDSDWYCTDNNPYVELAGGNLPPDLKIGAGLQIAYHNSQNQPDICSGILQTTLSFEDTCGDSVFGVEQVSAGCGVKFSQVGSEQCITDGSPLPTRNVKIELDPTCQAGSTDSIEIVTQVHAATDINGFVTGVFQDLTPLNFTSCGLFAGTGTTDFCDIAIECPGSEEPPP